MPWDNEHDLLAAESDRPLPSRPTKAPPGSARKCRVMAKRYRQGRHIHHPDDARDCVAGQTVYHADCGPRAY